MCILGICEAFLKMQDYKHFCSFEHRHVLCERNVMLCFKPGELMIDEFLNTDTGILGILTCTLVFPSTVCLCY